VANILFHPEAQAEYQAALAWYQARSPQAAARFETEMDLLAIEAGEMLDNYGKEP